MESLRASSNKRWKIDDKVRSRVLELTRTREVATLAKAGVGKGRRWRGRARARSRDDNHTNRNERARSGPRLPHKYANETERGKWADLPDLDEARHGRIYIRGCGHDKYAKSRDVSLEMGRETNGYGTAGNRQRGVVYDD